MAYMFVAPRLTLPIRSDDFHRACIILRSHTLYTEEVSGSSGMVYKEQQAYPEAYALP